MYFLQIIWQKYTRNYCQAPKYSAGQLKTLDSTSAPEGPVCFDDPVDAHKLQPKNLDRVVILDVQDLSLFSKEFQRSRKYNCGEDGLDSEEKKKRSCVIITTVTLGLGS